MHMKKLYLKYFILFLSVISVCLLTDCSSPPKGTQIPYLDPCANVKPLEFDIEKAAKSPFGFVDPPDPQVSMVELGMESAQELASRLQPKNRICNLQISDETRSVIDNANQLFESGKRDEALNLLQQRLKLLSETAQSSHLQKPVRQSQNWRQNVRDVLGMAAAVYILGDDSTAFDEAAVEMIKKHGFQDLETADLFDSLSIEADAEQFGIEVLAERARARVEKIATEMADAELKNFDPCTTDIKTAHDFFDDMAQWDMLGVEGLDTPGEARFDLYAQKVELTAAYRWNAYVKEKGLPEDRLKPVPPCKADGQLEVIVFDGCSLEDVSIGMIDFAKEKGSSPVKVSGRGHISYANKGRIEASGLDCAITIDAEFTLEGKFLKEGKKEPRIEIKLTTDGKNSIKYDNPELQIHYENSFPFDEAIIMTWKDESVFPPFEESLLHYVLHITKSK